MFVKNIKLKTGDEDGQNLDKYDHIKQANRERILKENMKILNSIDQYCEAFGGPNAVVVDDLLVVCNGSTVRTGLIDPLKLLTVCGHDTIDMFNNKQKSKNNHHTKEHSFADGIPAVTKKPQLFTLEESVDTQRKFSSDMGHWYIPNIRKRYNRKCYISLNQQVKGQQQTNHHSKATIKQDVAYFKEDHENTLLLKEAKKMYNEPEKVTICEFDKKKTGNSIITSLKSVFTPKPVKSAEDSIIILNHKKNSSICINNERSLIKPVNIIPITQEEVHSPVCFDTLEETRQPSRRRVVLNTPDFESDDEQKPPRFVSPLVRSDTTAAAKVDRICAVIRMILLCCISCKRLTDQIDDDYSDEEDEL